ncbi:cupin domain-containing protein [Paenibacillus athensensis]|uniref:Cupin type-1 domain-containing protein n=1 Tax=Paenibacillus athensensis TaxID=1967502 RepID=A0A4Y8QBE2_9BACL|nr:cupin domain-containing protein [Paenibacillus athensensis]MCD1257534.1 cupin domain-containing protein [Paenibacillus athensensis]
MAVSYMDFSSPYVQFFSDVSHNRFYTKDQANYINILGVRQLNTLGNQSLLDIFLSPGNVVEPHLHQNATELVYGVSGAMTISILNPFTSQIVNQTLLPQQAVSIPQGWIHWEVATEDNTHVLAIFDAPAPEYIAISDFLRLAPRNALAHIYCLNEAQIREALAPLTESALIAPPASCTACHQAQHWPSPAVPEPRSAPAAPYAAVGDLNAPYAAPPVRPSGASSGVARPTIGNGLNYGQP